MNIPVWVRNAFALAVRRKGIVCGVVLAAALSFAAYVEAIKFGLPGFTCLAVLLCITVKTRLAKNVSMRQIGVLLFFLANIVIIATNRAWFADSSTLESVFMGFYAVGMVVWVILFLVWRTSETEWDEMGATTSVVSVLISSSLPVVAVLASVLMAMLGFAALSCSGYFSSTCVVGILFCTCVVYFLASVIFWWMRLRKRESPMHPRASRSIESAASIFELILAWMSVLLIGDTAASMYSNSASGFFEAIGYVDFYIVALTALTAFSSLKVFAYFVKRHNDSLSAS